MPISLNGITVTPYPKIYGKARSFETTITALEFGPILFVDYFGVSSFYYTNKLQVDENIGDNVRPVSE